MGLFDKKQKSYLPPDVDPEVLLKDFMPDIEALVEAILSGADNTDLAIADMVEGCQEQVRIAIVEKISQMVRERSEEKAKALDQALQEQKMLEHHKQKRVMQEWLAYFMSQETLRKLRESFLARPGMQKEIENIGQDLARKGVLQNMQLGNKQDLGGLSANVQQTRDAGRGQGPGRG